MLFNSKSNYPIGLDISDGSLKLVQLKKVGDKIKIQALGKVNLPSGLFNDGEVLDKAKVAEAIKKLLDNPKFGKVTSREVVACLPETKTFVKLIEVKKTETNILKAIEEEIEKHVPMNLDEIYYDWQEIKDLPDKKKILIGVAPRDTVNQYTDLLDEAKLSVVSLEIEPVSFCRSLLPEEHYKFKGEKNKNYGIIDIGARRSNMTFYSKNTILFAFSMPISGNKITKKISETLKIDFKQAEKAKIICGLDENKAQGIIKDTLHSMIKELIVKMNDSLMFYNHHFVDNGPIDKIILCGGGANIKDLDKIINDYFSIKVEVGNALVNLNEDKERISELFSETHSVNINFSSKNKGKMSKVKQDTNITFATAIGLALRGIFINKL